MAHNETKGISRLRKGTSDCSLPTFAWPGGYPVYYVDSGNNVLCPKCANENDEFSERLVRCEENWEDPALHCDHCSERIESAYAEDEAEVAEPEMEGMSYWEAAVA